MTNPGKIIQIEPLNEPDDVHELLSLIQRKLKAPKSQHNKFGNYNYRNCEDILEAVKPLLPTGAWMKVSDEIVTIGDRFYVKATARLFYKGAYEENTAYAREPLAKKGMDESQITGATSSYARKYSLNGLLLIDDTKDADSDDKSNSKTSDDRAAAKALGGGVKSHLDEDQINVMYDQALKSLDGCVDFDGLKKVWANYWKTKTTFHADQWNDIEQKYNECKSAFTTGVN